jgi:hypothetical protein
MMINKKINSEHEFYNMLSGLLLNFDGLKRPDSVPVLSGILSASAADTKTTLPDPAGADRLFYFLTALCSMIKMEENVCAQLV